MDFPSSEGINNGRPMPGLKGLLQTTEHKITRATPNIERQTALKIFGTSRIDLTLDERNKY
jgi:hypothetical protein